MELSAVAPAARPTARPFVAVQQRRPLAAAASGAWQRPAVVAGAALLAAQRGRRRSAGRRCGGGNVHETALQRWVSDFIIEEGVCPWAALAVEGKNVRYVGSKATTTAEVKRELTKAAMELPRMGPVDEGVACTALLAFPDVPEFEEFAGFWNFYEQELKHGDIFDEEMGLKVLAYHPKFSRYGCAVNEGDRITVTGPDGEKMTGEVIDPLAGEDEDGELLAVEFEDGQKFIVPYGCVEAVTSASGEPQSEITENLAARAPRPIFHLLRFEDTDMARRMGAAGEGPSVDEVHEHRMARLDALGEEGVQGILDRCG